MPLFTIRYYSVFTDAIMRASGCACAFSLWQSWLAPAESAAGLCQSATRAAFDGYSQHVTDHASAILRHGALFTHQRQRYAHYTASAPPLRRRAIRTKNHMLARELRTKE